MQKLQHTSIHSLEDATIPSQLILQANPHYLHNVDSEGNG